jgi:hypothetical protein
MRSSAARRRRAESGCLHVSRCGCRPDLSLRGSSKSEDYAIEINPPDDCLDHPGMPVRREEVDAPVRPLRESLREADLGPTGTQVDHWQSQQPAFARFKDDRRTADLARMASQLGRLLSNRLAAGFVGEHGGREYRRHHASRRAGDKLPDRRELSKSRHLCAEHRPAHHGFRDARSAPHPTSRGGGTGAAGEAREGRG